MRRRKGLLLRLGRACAFAVSLGHALSCSSAAPASPSGPDASSGAIDGSTRRCRTYAASFTHLSMTPSGAIDTMVHCSFDVGARTMACSHVQTSAQQDCRLEFETATTYASVADFLGESIGNTRAMQMARRSVVAPPAECPVSSITDATTSYAYDVARRLLLVTTTSEGGPAVVTSYVLWDGLGRPTLGFVTTGGRSSAVVSYVYDDPGRSYTQILTPSGGQQLTTVVTYDTDGLLLRSQEESAEGPVDVLFTTGSRTQVCQ